MLLLCLVAPLMASAAFDPALLCTLVVSGTKINDPRACNKWIECIDGKPVSGSCEDAQYYDRETQACVTANSITCVSSDPCAADANGFAPDPYSCNGYFYCQNGKGTRGVCNEGLNYNPGTASCIRNFPCPSKPNPDSVCNILADGVFIKDDSRCNGWQMCWKGQVINGTCPGNFYFSGSQGECDYPQNVECSVPTTLPPTAQPDECPEAGAFVSDKSSCNGYYYCRPNAAGQMELLHGICADERFFSPANGGACVPRSQIVCNYDRCAGLGYTTIQLANESSDDCAGFAICQNGVTIGQSSCPDGEYFDELSQRCTSEVIAYAACSQSAQSSTTESTTSDANGDDTTQASTPAGVTN
ncbi:CG6996 [Drosophila busckii]|uniref:CG6996 n=1 Tax=Drosophila busckii TaxID=30019 RepID=A0A0M5JBH1_DROBS|nr:CG6996 [Drosophila busckii]